MKKMMVMLLMATVALTANAQNTLRENGSFTLQPKVGLAVGYLSGEWTNAAGVDKKARTGFLAGLEGEYYAKEWLGIAFGLNYAQQGWKAEGNNKSQTTKLDYLNVPVTADFYVAKGLALKTGAQFGFLISDKSGDYDIKDGSNNFNFSIPIGISYEFSNVVFDLRYNVSVSKVNKDGSDKCRSDLLQLTVGYKFSL